MNMTNPNMPDEYVEHECLSREEAEKGGLYDNGNPLKLSDQQEYDLWCAMSTLSQLADSSNSSLSKLLSSYGYTIS